MTHLVMSFSLETINTNYIRWLDMLTATNLLLQHNLLSCLVQWQVKRLVECTDMKTPGSGCGFMHLWLIVGVGMTGIFKTEPWIHTALWIRHLASKWTAPFAQCMLGCGLDQSPATLKRISDAQGWIGWMVEIWLSWVFIAAAWLWTYVRQHL